MIWRWFRQHNPRSGGCRYFSYSFDTLSEICPSCE